MNTFKIYAAHSMTGLTGEEVCEYYGKITRTLRHIGLEVLHPLIAKGGLKDRGTIESHGYKDISLARDHAIKERDQWMVSQSDIVLVDLSGTTEVSIGCVSELAWADLLGKHSILVLEEGNIHTHAFPLQEADVIFRTLDDALDYISKLVNTII